MIEHAFQPLCLWTKVLPLQRHILLDIKQLDYLQLGAEVTRYEVVFSRGTKTRADVHQHNFPSRVEPLKDTKDTLILVETNIGQS